MRDGLTGIGIGVVGTGADALVSIRFETDDDERPTIEFRFPFDVADELAATLKSAALIARLGGDPSPN